MRAGPADEMLNYFGGPPVNGTKATVQRDTIVKHSGNASYRIDANVPISDFGFVGTSLAGLVPGYVDTRDISRFQQIVFWINNETDSPFVLKFEIKDYRDDNFYRVQWPITIASTGGWTEHSIPLDLDNPGWQVIGNKPDLTRAKLFTFVIEATQGASVDGSIYLDDVTLIEPGGAVPPLTTPISTLTDRLTERMFDGLWGTRDRSTGFLPYDSAYPDRVGTNVTAALVKVLPTAVNRGWIDQAEADNYVTTLVTGLNTMMNSATYLPFRYAD
jgi:hypothetical protein